MITAYEYDLLPVFAQANSDDDTKADEPLELDEELPMESDDDEDDEEEAM